MKTSVHLSLTHFFLEWEMFQTFRENQNKHFVFNNFFSKKVPFMRYCGKILYSQTGHRWQYGTCAMHAGYLRIQTYTHNMQHLLFSTITMVTGKGLRVMLRVECPSCFYMTMRHTTQYAVSFFNGPHVLVLPSNKPQDAGPLPIERAKWLYWTRALLPWRRNSNFINFHLFF
jgi:hypothetical protein